MYCNCYALLWNGNTLMIVPALHEPVLRLHLIHLHLLTCSCYVFFSVPYNLPAKLTLHRHNSLSFFFFTVSML